MNAKAKKTKSYSGVGTAPVVIVVCLIIAICIFKYVLGNPDNFMNGDPNGHPLPETCWVLFTKVVLWCL